MERILQKVPATISASWYQDGTIADPGAVTVTITRHDGSTVTSGSATGTGAAPRTFNLTAVHTALLDCLTVTWVSGTLGTLTTQVEVVGGFLFSLSDARKLKPLDDTAKYPTSDLIDARILVETALEDACGVAFVPRYRWETVSGSGGAFVLLDRAHVSAIRSVSVNGTAVTDLSTVVPGPGGALYTASNWAAGFQNVVVAYEHGYTFPPARVTQAARMLVKRWLVDGPIDDRITSMSTDEGTFSLVTPGLSGVLFDLPEVNAVVEEYNERRVFA